ncbi:MAG TPA: hypothetical protein VMB72_00060 [Acidimicrobiales bacterium]|nr:hypothetical protein [Acidimicrobiales bacterium]
MTATGDLASPHRGEEGDEEDRSPGRPWRRGRSGRRRGRPEAPADRAHRCVVLACTPEDTTAVDLDSGAVVRLRIDWGERPGALAPFDVVDAAWAEEPEPDDLAQPEAVTVAGTPSSLGVLAPRHARRLLRALVLPAEHQLLGFPGSSAPYWEFRGMRPSVAVIVPSRGPLLLRRRQDDSVWARFGSGRSDNWLPLEDERAVLALHAARRDRLAGKDLAAALGYRPSFLVVTLSRPRDGYCYKVVAALLPRP